MLPTCFSGRLRPPEVRSILRTIKHRSGILLPVCCRHAGFSTKSSSEPPRVPISRGTPPAHRQLPRNRWRTLRSSALKRGRNGLFLLHPTFHNALSSYTTSVFDASRLFRASAVDFRRIPPWRHQTGSSFLEWFLVLPTCFPGRPRPPESRPIVRNIKHRSGILLPVCCRHAGFSTKSSSRTSTSANFTWDPSRTPATASKPMVHSMILRVETWWQRTGPTSPDRLWVISSLFVDRFRCG